MALAANVESHMAEGSSAPEVGILAPDAAPESNAIKIYASRPGAQLRFGLIFIGLGLLGLLPLKGISNWLSGGPVPDIGAFLALSALLFLPLGILAILNVPRGLPRLTITPRGVALKYSLGTKWATWDSLAPFAIKTVYAGRFRQAVEMASGRLVGQNASWSVRRAKT